MTTEQPETLRTIKNQHAMRPVLSQPEFRLRLRQVTFPQSPRIIRSVFRGGKKSAPKWRDICQVAGIPASFNPGKLILLRRVFAALAALELQLPEPAWVWVVCVNRFPVYVITTFWLRLGH
ncbi:MAG TPA: hypothetical protein VG962_11965 [Steroidobacteraceae bacterium]|nr:hypothetical protein [Steroidobacteraceae bacterium]